MFEAASAIFNSPYSDADHYGDLGLARLLAGG